MSNDENKAMVRRLFEAWNVTMRPGATDTDRASVAAMETVIAIAAPEIVEAFRRDVETFRRLFGAHRIEITDIIAEGDRVWVRVDTSGGHTGEWLGIPPTGKRWTNPGALFYRLAGGRIVEEQMVFDTLNHVRQLGAALMPSEIATSS